MNDLPEQRGLGVDVLLEDGHLLLHGPVLVKEEVKRVHQGFVAQAGLLELVNVLLVEPRPEQLVLHDIDRRRSEDLLDGGVQVHVVLLRYGVADVHLGLVHPRFQVLHLWRELVIHRFLDQVHERAQFGELRHHLLDFGVHDITGGLLEVVADTVGDFAELLLHSCNDEGIEGTAKLTLGGRLLPPIVL